MAKLPHLSGRFGRPRGWRRWLMLTFLMLWVALFGAYLYLASPSRAAKLAGDFLGAMAGTQVRIDSAHFGFDGTITLHGLEMRVQGVHGEAGRLFEADQALIRHDVLRLLTGEFQVQKLTFIKPTLYLTELVDTDRFNFQALHEPGAQTVRRVPDRLPELFLRQGLVVFGEVRGEVFRRLADVHLGGNFTVSPSEPGVYFFSLRQQQLEREAAETQLALNGRFDLRDLVVTASLNQFAFDSPQRAMLPRRLRSWWDRLEPVGTLPSVRFGYDPDPKVGFNAELELGGVAITLPYGELDSRMTGVTGRFGIRGDVITISDLTGRIEDLQYVINGSVQGFSPDAPFKLWMRTDRFAIPEQPRYLLALPRGVQKQFRKFSPSGVFKASVVLERARPGSLLTYDGSVQISDARLVYDKFPYPLEGVKGQLRFNDERIELIALRGRGPTGADVEVNGWIAPPQDGAAAHVVVTAVDSPIDHVLYDAIPPKHRPILDMFFDAEAHSRLIEQGLIQTDEQQRARLGELEEIRARLASLDPQLDFGQADQLGAEIERVRGLVEIPVFELGGRTTVIAQSSRPLGLNKKSELTIAISTTSVNALFKYWPYPLRGTGGRLLIKPGEVVVDAIGLEGLSGAVGRVTGTLVPRADDLGGGLAPRLDLVIDAMPVDELLYATIDPPQDYWLRGMHLRGMLRGDGQVTLDKDGQIDFRIHTDLAEGSARPFGGSYTVEQMSGSGTLRRDGIQIESLSGQHGTSTLNLVGGADWGGGASQLDLDITATKMDLNDPVFDLLPPGLGDVPQAQVLYEQFQPAGVFDAKLTYRQSGDQPADYRLGLRFESLRFVLRDTQIELTDLVGDCVLTPKGVELDGWGASFATGRFLAWGLARFGQDGLYDLTFDAHSESICPTTRAVVPSVVLDVIDGLSLEGAYEVHGARFYYKTDPEQDDYRFNGKASLSSASAAVGVPITEMFGDLTIKATQQDNSLWPLLDLKLDADRLLAAGRLVSPVSVQIVTSDQPDWLDIRDLRGACYGGMLLGSGRMHLEGSGLYQIGLVLQDVALNPFIYSEVEPSPPETLRDTSDTAGSLADEAGEPLGQQYTGVLSASLDIEGYLSESLSRRGRGDLEIRDANLYEVPLSLALIQLLNLTLPSSKSFDHASASYLIDDDLVLFDSVRFEAPTVEIIGSGVMEYDSQELDLQLYTRNPSGPRGAFFDLLKVFKDELLSIHVTGTLEDPKPQATSFQGFKRSWANLFGRSDPRTRQLLPK